jgi:hypothetical protein
MSGAYDFKSIYSPDSEAYLDYLNFRHQAVKQNGEMSTEELHALHERYCKMHDALFPDWGEA